MRNDVRKDYKQQCILIFPFGLLGNMVCTFRTKFLDSELQTQQAWVSVSLLRFSCILLIQGGCIAFTAYVITYRYLLTWKKNLGRRAKLALFYLCFRWFSVYFVVNITCIHLFKIIQLSRVHNNALLKFECIRWCLFSFRPSVAGWGE